MPDRNPLRALEAAIYGRIPTLPVSVLEKRPVEPCRLNRGVCVERWRAQAHLRARQQPFDILVASPGVRPRAILLVQVFQRTRDGLAHVGRALSHGARLSFAEVYISVLLGQHIHAPPWESVLKRGFAMAFFCPGDVAPDRREQAPAMLAQMDGGSDSLEPPGALAAWAGLASSVRKTIAADERFDGLPIVVWGHSRHGKAALLAAAADQSFSAVIAHQSGRFGASLTKGGAGETPAQIARA